MASLHSESCFFVFGGREKERGMNEWMLFICVCLCLILKNEDYTHRCEEMINLGGEGLFFRALQQRVFYKCGGEMGKV